VGASAEAAVGEGADVAALAADVGEVAWDEAAVDGADKVAGGEKEISSGRWAPGARRLTKGVTCGRCGGGRGGRPWRGGAEEKKDSFFGAAKHGQAAAALTKANERGKVGALVDLLRASNEHPLQEHRAYGASFSCRR